MKRREFLRGLTGASLAMMTSGVACKQTSHSAANDAAMTTKPSTWYLNVVVHGTFAIVVDLKGSRYKQGPKVRLLAPRVSKHLKHRYVAKTFQAIGSDNLQETWSYEVVSPSSVAGGVTFPAPNATTFDPRDDQNRIVIMVDKTSDVSGQPAWTIDLPAIPTDICQLRAAHNNFLNPGLTYMSSQLNFGQWSPLVNVIRYEFSSVSAPNVSFSPATGITQQVMFDGNVARLHVFAEPDSAPVCGDGHLQDAINEFNNLFHVNLDLSLIPTAECLGLNSDPIPDTCKAGLLLCEERSLEELLNNESCSKFSSGKPVQQQYADDPKASLVAPAWANFLAIAAAEISLAKREERSALAKESKKFIEKNKRFLDANGKPPSNCMSMVALNP
jgi:hypothetical protein